jgi:multicomponent Na+:H+ antiporter subunit E
MNFLLTAAVMFAFWILMSGEFNVILITSGIVSSLFVAYISHDLLIERTNVKTSITRLVRLYKYLPWLMWQIVLSNIDVVYRTLHPKMPIDPIIIRFKTDLKSEMGNVILANSITLTPGTVTIDITKDGEFIVHAIAREPAESLLAGDMQRKAKEIEGVDL